MQVSISVPRPCSRRRAWLVRPFDGFDQADINDLPSIAGQNHNGCALAAVGDRLGVSDCDFASTRRLETVGAEEGAAGSG